MLTTRVFFGTWFVGLGPSALPRLCWPRFQAVEGSSGADAGLDDEPSTRNIAAKNDSQSHLNGLRGLATLIVYNWHIFVPFYPKLFHPYQDRHSDSIIQLPLLRSIFCGYPMNIIFAVLSGYVQSLKPLRDARTGDAKAQVDRSYRRIIKRVIRLMIPCLIVTFVELVATRLDLFDTDILGDVPFYLKAMFPLKAITLAAQFKDWLSFNMSLLRIWDPPMLPASNYGPHLWTMPHDIRSSICLSLLQLLSLPLNTTTRIFDTILTTLFASQILPESQSWSIISTFTGYILAQLSTVPQDPIASTILRHLRSLATPLFLAGLYLETCPPVPFDPINPPPTGFPLFRTTVPLYFLGTGTLAVISIMAPPEPMKKLLMAPFLQYMGRISFSFYMCHQAPVLLLGYPMVRYCQNTFGMPVLWAAATTSVALLPLCVVLGDMFDRYVERPLRGWVERYI